MLLAGGDREQKEYNCIHMNDNFNTVIEQDNKYRFYNVFDVMYVLGVSKAKAYQEIKILNEELSNKGYRTVSGKVPVKYFKERHYC